MGFLNIVDERFLMESLADVVDKIGSFLFVGIVFGFLLVLAAILWVGFGLRTMITLQEGTLDELRKLNGAREARRREIPVVTPIRRERERSRVRERPMKME